jgi:leucyl/phenylalanyl-tRNA--protein transferase
VLFPEEFRISRSLAKTLRNRGFETTLDHAFAEVMERCADRSLRPEGTWITPQMSAAYRRLHDSGHAHSVEVWLDGRLAGGLYGVALGRVYFGESMFSLERDASKVALERLVRESGLRGFELIDCQVSSEHLRTLGAREIPRREFVALLERAIPDLAAGAPWRDA